MKWKAIKKMVEVKVQNLARFSVTLLCLSDRGQQCYDRFLRWKKCSLKALCHLGALCQN